MGKQVVQLRSYGEDTAIRAGDFLLTPSNPTPPYITGQPLRNITQTSWIKEIRDGEAIFKSIKPSFNTVAVLKETEISFQLFAADPSNVADQNSTDNLSYRWQKDGADIFEINSLEGGIGIPGIAFSATPDTSGEYICTVSNNYGSIESQPFTLEVVDPLKHPKLYKNLLLNGDGDGGLDGWSSIGSVEVKPFLDSIPATKNFGSFNLAGLALINQNSYDTNSETPGFYFSSANHWGCFFPHYLKRAQKDPNFLTPNVPSVASAVLDGAEQWVSQGIPANIVLNEDYREASHAGFFPGLAWIDRYNKNLTTVGLVSDFKDYTPTYFTRSKIRFKKFGEPDTASLQQLVDLTDVGNMIDGDVCGIDNITAQFFAYIGAGISGYDITLTLDDDTTITTNYQIAQPELWYNELVLKANESFVGTVFSTIQQLNSDIARRKQGKGKFPINSEKPRYQLKTNSPIIITPKLYDITDVELKLYEDGGREMDTITVKGPTAKDVWAIKEKVFFPITLVSLFNHITPDGVNDIIVFDQKYTDTQALAGFFEDAPGKLSAFPSLDLDNITDPVARFFLQKYNFKEYNAAIPDNIWYMEEKRKYQGINDHGAAAMFGVSTKFVLPKRCRSIAVTVNFLHQSNMFEDVNPRMKGWESEEIYADDFGQPNDLGKRLLAYGNPRCGITKMKLLLGVNNLEISTDYPTYYLPPDNATVLGLQRARLQYPDEFDNTKLDVFKYKLVQPDGLPEPPQTVTTIRNLNDYQASLDKESAKLVDENNLNNTPPVPSVEDITSVEDLEQNAKFEDS